jgi:hypothetical protein
MSGPITMALHRLLVQASTEAEAETSHAGGRALVSLLLEPHARTRGNWSNYRSGTRCKRGLISCFTIAALKRMPAARTDPPGMCR